MEEKFSSREKKENKFNLQQKIANTAKNVLLRMCLDHKKERRSLKQETYLINRIKHFNTFFDHVINTNSSTFFNSIYNARKYLRNFYNFINDHFGTGDLLNDNDEDIGYRIVMFILINFNVHSLNKAINCVNNITTPIVLSNDLKSEIIRAFRTASPATNLDYTIVEENDNLLLHLMTIYVFSSCFEDIEQITIIKENIDNAIYNILPLKNHMAHAITISIYEAFKLEIPSVIQSRIPSIINVLESHIEELNKVIKILNEKINTISQNMQELIQIHNL